MRKAILFIFIFSLHVIDLFGQTVTEYNLPPAPIYKCGDAPAKLNQVLFGAVPPNSEDKPVILFVHGWGDNGYSWFSAKNDWYQKCYNEGFKTAFCFQSSYDAFQENGKVVAEMIRRTAKKFNTTNIIIIAHSKGGLDTEWALYNYGMIDSIKGVIAMASPFYGVPIIDLISNPILRFVIENIPILGTIVKAGGTYQMTSPYVSTMRDMFDNHPKNNPQQFRCFGAYNHLNQTQFPKNIPDDFFKILFYDDYKPLCIDLPIGQIGGAIMSLGMSVAGIVTQFVNVPEIYTNPQKNTKDSDGLVPYYSAIRPGAVEISSRTSPVSNINHIDELFTWYTWDIIKDNIYYFINNQPTAKLSNKKIEKKVDTNEPIAISSKLQFNQDKDIHFKISKNTTANLFLVGNYNNLDYKIINSKNEIVQQDIIDIETKNIYNLFNTIPINQLTEGDYTLIANQKLNSLVIDDSQEDIELSLDKEQQLKVKLNNWNENIDNIDIKVIANRILDENGQLIWDKIIPIQLEKNASDMIFENNNLVFEKAGYYNFSVYVKGSTAKRFLSSNIYIKKSNPIKNTVSSISLYPNTTDDVFTVEWQNKNIQKNYIQIFDINGNIIYKTTIQQADVKNSVRLSAKTLNMPKGLYIINIDGSSSKLVVE